MSRITQTYQHCQHIRHSVRICFKYQIAVCTTAILNKINQQFPQRNNIIHLCHAPSSPEFPVQSCYRLFYSGGKNIRLPPLQSTAHQELL